MQSRTWKTIKLEMGIRLNVFGFIADDDHFGLTNQHGDYAVVHVQRLQRGENGIFVNLQGTPAPWIDYFDNPFPQQAYATAIVPDAPMCRKRLRRTDSSGHGPGDIWSLVADSAAGARLLVDEIVPKLIDEGFPVLKRWLDRDELVDDVQCGQNARVVLLAEQGPSRELSQELMKYHDAPEFVRWAAEYAERQAAKRLSPKTSGNGSGGPGASM